MSTSIKHTTAGTISGTTTQLGEDILTLALSGDQCLLILKNTDLANDLVYSITGRAVPNGLDDPVTLETLAKGDTISMVILDPYCELTVFLQDSTPASHAAFQLDYSAR